MKTQRSLFRATVRICLIVIIALVGLVALACLIATTSPGERILRGWLEGQLNEISGQIVTVGSFETNLFSRVEITEIAVSDSAALDSQPLLRVERLRVEYSLWPLIRKELALRLVAVDGIELAAERDSAGQFSYAFQPALEATPTDTTLPDTTPSAFTITVDSAAVRRLALRYRDQQTAMTADIPDIAITAVGGGENTYRFAIDIDSIHTSYEGLSPPAGDLTVRGVYSPAELRLDTISMRLADMLFSARAEMVTEADTTINASLTVAGNPNSLLQMAAEWDSLPVIRMDRGIDIQTQMTGSLAAPYIHTLISVPLIEVEDYRLTDAVLHSQWRNDSIFVDSLYCNLFGGNVRASAQTVIDTTYAAQATISLDRIDLTKVWSTLYGEPSPYKGTIGGVISVAGEGEQIQGWQAAADLQIKKMKYEDQRLPDFTAQLSLEDGQGRLAIRQENVRFDARARMVEDRLSGDFTAVIPDLQPLAGFFNLSDVTGTVNASGTLAGTLESPSAEIIANAGRITFQNFPVDTVEAQVQYQDSVLHISRFAFSGELDAIDPDYPLFDIDSLTGGFQYAGEVSGTVESLRGKLDLDLYEPGFGDYQADSGHFSISIDGPRIQLKQGAVYVDSFQLETAGEFNLTDSTGSCDIRAYALSSPPTIGADGETVPEAERPPAGLQSVGEITSTFRLLDAEKVSLSAHGRDFDLGIASRLIPDTLNIGGYLTFDLDFSGNLDEPLARLTLDVGAPYYEAVELDTFSVALSFQGDELTVQTFDVRGPQQQLSGQAIVEFQRDSVGAFIVDESSRVEGVVEGEIGDLALLQPFLPEGSSLAGRSTIQLQWDGILANPHLVGQLALYDGRFQASADTEPVNKIKVNITLQDSQLIIDTASVEIYNRAITVEGSAMLIDRSRLQTDIIITPEGTGGGTIDGWFSADSLDALIRIEEFDLSPFAPFVPDVDSLRGLLDCRLELRGEAVAPELKGYLTVRGLAGRSAFYPVAARNGVIKLSFDWNRVTIDSVFAQLNNGTVFLSGDLAYDTGQITDVELTFIADNVEVESPREYRVHLQSAQLSYTKPGEYFLLGGDIQFGESRFLAKLKPQQILPWAQSVETAEPELPPFMEQTRLDIRIRESSQLWVDNNVARLRLHTDMRIIGSPVKPNFSGRVNVEEGYVLYVDRKFEIKTGSIMFLDPNRLNPELNLSAESRVTSYQATEASKYLITFSVTGTMEEPVISLTSQPPLDKPDIISLLTVGATRSELLGKEGDGQAGGTKDVLKSRAGVLASQQISGYLGRKAGDFLGLDQVTVEGNLFQPEGRSQARVLASKRISERVEMTYSTTVGHLNDQSFRLDYKLTERFSLEGQTDQRGRSSANLKYRLLFR